MKVGLFFRRACSERIRKAVALMAARHVQQFEWRDYGWADAITLDGRVDQKPKVQALPTRPRPRQISFWP
jgi:hypothetical protein